MRARNVMHLLKQSDHNILNIILSEKTLQIEEEQIENQDSDDDNSLASSISSSPFELCEIITETALVEDIKDDESLPQLVNLEQNSKFEIESLKLSKQEIESSKLSRLEIESKKNGRV